MEEKLVDKISNGLLVTTFKILLAERTRHSVHRECFGSIWIKPDILVTTLTWNCEEMRKETFIFTEGNLMTHDVRIEVYLFRKRANSRSTVLNFHLFKIFRMIVHDAFLVQNLAFSKFCQSVNTASRRIVLKWRIINLMPMKNSTKHWIAIWRGCCEQRFQTEFAV